MTEDQLAAAAEDLATKIIEFARSEAAKQAPKDEAFGIAVGGIIGALIGCAGACGMSKAGLFSMIEAVAEGVLE